MRRGAARQRGGCGAGAHAGAMQGLRAWHAHGQSARACMQGRMAACRAPPRAPRACMTLPNAFLRPSDAHWSTASPMGVAGVMG
jgi:hypothetical protein